MLEAPYQAVSDWQPNLIQPFYYLRDTRGFVILIGDAACRDYVLGLKFDDFQFGMFI